METRAFGIKLIESVTGGSSYDDSLRRLLILEDELDVLKWKAFWKHSKEGGEKLKDQLTTIVESLELMRAQSKDELKSETKNS